MIDLEPCTAMFSVTEMGYWLSVPDGDPRAFAFYKRHYNYRDYKDGRRNRHGNPSRFLIMGPGNKLVLLGNDERALFGWRRGIDASQGYGVSCTIFRNEGERLSSDLIKEADQLAWQRWPERRHFTYVNPCVVKSSNPGYCFIKAGWRKCGLTKGGLIILEIENDGTKQ